MGMGRKFGTAIAALGVAVIAAGVFVGGAAAQSEEGQQEPERLECPSSSFTINWADVQLDAITSATGQTFSDGTFTITLANAEAIPGDPLDLLHIGSMDFTASPAITAAELQLWQAPGDYAFVSESFDPAAASGTFVSPPDSLGGETQAPIKGFVLCYPKLVVTTTTAAPTTTSVAPEQIIVTTTTAAPTTTTVPEVAVLPQVETAPQIAFTGSTSGPLVIFGATLLLLGLSLVGIDRLGLIRRFRHSR
jgi:hypothetical protein